MQVGFAGTPAFAAAVLDAVLAAGFAVPLVLTQPDRPKGRGLKLEASAVKRLALERSLYLLHPVTLQTEGARAAAFDALDALDALDVLVVAAYGLLLPPAILARPRLGCVNVHPSPLPRWRGAAPIERALLAGDTETGVTIMQMDAGLDTGPTLGFMRVGIAPRETAGTLRDKLAVAGAQAIVAVLERFARGETVRATPQPAQGMTYAVKIGRADATINWRMSVQCIDRQVRAFNPTPGAATAFAGQPVKVWTAEPMAAAVPGRDAGMVLAADSAGLVVAAGDGALRLSRLQPAGGRSMTAAAFAAGRRITIGDRFDVT